ncbi:zinc finger protein 543 [Lucilia sericata]|uniref:zinc finger protein 543 n=1 Tax=Lucilia sericata TaxID=13632 RepID=UPI0018A8796B|nr:zinc finger protein 543 [Lucilia sericata]
MATSVNPKEVFMVNCHEIPETICVETRFITHASVYKPKQCEQLFYITHKNGKLELTRQEDSLVATKVATTLPKPSTVTLSIQAKAASLQPATTGPIIPLKTAFTSSCNFNANEIGGKNLITSSVATNPHLNTLGITNRPLVRPTVNDQTQQTELSTLNTKSIAIQCKLDEEIYDVGDEWTPITDKPSGNEENPEIDIESFLKFVKDNSAQHKNFKECLICGEVCKSKKYFYGHMAIHQGPRILCSKCGQYLDNEKLLFKHNCYKEKQLEKAFLQCPHHSCSVAAISHLELYDHINEHDNNRMYKCSACRRGFCTGQEFLRHILIRAKCYTSAKRKRFYVYGLESHKERLCRVRVFTLHTFKKRTILVKTFLSQRVAKQGTCKICLRPFTNRSVFNHHRMKCLTKFRKRLLRKRYGKANSVGSC